MASISNIFIDQGATFTTTVTVTDDSGSTARPVVFHNESNALLDDTGSFTYNPESYYVESDTFTYIVTDGQYYDTAEVTLARLVSGVDIATIIEINTEHNIKIFDDQRIFRIL